LAGQSCPANAQTIAPATVFADLIDSSFGSGELARFQIGSIWKLASSFGNPDAQFAG
jgi:hypothetical protein